MPERLGFDRELSGRAFLAHHWRLSGGDPARTETEVLAAAGRVDLEPAALGKTLRTYSRGMLQRIGVAQATFGDPSLLFLDEPASGTDPLGVAVVRDRILEAKTRGATIVLNSHQLAEVERVCDRVVFIDRGRIAREETLRGEGAASRRAILRTDPARAAEAASRSPRTDSRRARRATGRSGSPDPRPISRAPCGRSSSAAIPSSRPAPRRTSRSSSGGRRDRVGAPPRGSESRFGRRVDLARHARPARRPAPDHGAVVHGVRHRAGRIRRHGGHRFAGRGERGPADDPVAADPPGAVPLRKVPGRPDPARGFPRLRVRDGRPDRPRRRARWLDGRQRLRVAGGLESRRRRIFPGRRSTRRSCCSSRRSCGVSGTRSRSCSAASS